MPMTMPLPVTTKPALPGVDRMLIALAGLFGAAGVALAAMAAHVHGGANLVTASQFLLMHAAALAGLVALSSRLTRGETLVRVAAILIAIGTMMFSGDLALRALRDTPLLWGTAPFGGIGMMLGWAILAIAAFRAR